MQDLIKREDAINLIRNIAKESNNISANHVISALKDGIDRVEYRGKWSDGKGIGEKENIRTCSACGVRQTVTYYDGKVMFRYCPYCGAKMYES